MKIYVDGSYHKKYKLSSFGYVFLDDDNTIIEKGNGLIEDKKMNEMRNVAGEIMSVILVMKICEEKNIKNIDIYYDYKGIEMWATNTKTAWKCNNIYTNSYRKKMLEYYEKGFSITFHKVKSHTNDKYNDLADSLAKSAFKKVIS